MPVERLIPLHPAKDTNSAKEATINMCKEFSSSVVIDMVAQVDDHLWTVGRGPEEENYL